MYEDSKTQFVRKSEEKKPLGRLRHRWEDNIILSLKE